MAILRSTQKQPLPNEKSIGKFCPLDIFSVSIRKAKNVINAAQKEGRLLEHLKGEAK